MPLNPDKHFVNLKGKRYCLYSGLLELAHEQGLSEIRTDLIQTPTPDNGEVAIVKARVTTAKGVFEGIGDASPSNTGRSIQPHSIRHAETRAKARALRDAINVSVAALEEMGEEEPRGQSPAGSSAGNSLGASPPARGDEGQEKPATTPAMTPAQFGKLLGELEAGGYTRAAFEARHGKIGNLSKAEAARLIERLVKANEAKPAKPTVMTPGAPYPEEVE